MLQERQQCFSEFASNNISRWKSGFDLLESHIITCTEAGENINTSYRTEAVENNDLLFLHFKEVWDKPNFIPRLIYT